MRALDIYSFLANYCLIKYENYPKNYPVVMNCIDCQTCVSNVLVRDRHRPTSQVDENDESIGPLGACLSPKPVINTVNVWPANDGKCRQLKITKICFNI